jgi:hypothetical protein
MTAIDNTPENKNFLSPLNFKFILKRSPHVNFFLQKVNLPEISLKSSVQPNPFANINLPGDHLEYGLLNVTFKVDEDLQNYLEIHNWLKALGKPEDFEGRRAIRQKPLESGEGEQSDLTLMILTSSKHANYEVVFADAMPITLGGMEVNTVDTDVNYITASATFKYDYYDIVKS